MAKLQLSGIDLCTSPLTQRPYRAAPCELLVSITPQNCDDAAALLKKLEASHVSGGLRVSGIPDLSFLSELPNLRYLEIADQKQVDIRPLDGLSNLRGLRLESPGAGLDFACFPELETFIGDWHADNTNVARARELRRLLIWHFKPQSCDLADLAGAVRLEELAITQTSITSLAGLESLPDLRYLDVAYAAKLESLEVFASGKSDVRELSLSKAKNVASYQPLAAIPYLRRLKLSTCAPMPDLRWTAGMNELDFFSFVETNVADNDLSPLLQLPKLRYVGTMDKRSYNYKCEAINEILAKRDAG